jgi:gamma-glutamyl:cysteine ligase YbdK (ATP-grasp superfamily)
MSSRLHLFDAYGVELEYMIVDRTTSAVKPVADELLRAVAGEYVSEVDQGEISWSNELVAHVVELKTTDPARSLVGLDDLFTKQVAHINELLAPLNAQLMPTGAHPWMDPLKETKLWPHDYSVVYETFNRIFGCQGHGWSNLQSVHLNLPFADDAEFARLHAAIRLLLPILPALAASSPVLDGRPTGQLDSRLDVYRSNSRKIPSITGSVIPEPVYSEADYERTILQRIYADIAPEDPEEVLQDEWLNARGAIARFQRNTIEIRVLDVQECPAADLAICAAIVGVLKLLVTERWAPLAEQQAWPVEPLVAILSATIRDGERATIDNAAYFRSFGFEGSKATAGQLWGHLIGALQKSEPVATTTWQPTWNVLLDEGPLARRILAALDRSEPLAEVYRRLAHCLATGQMFRGE